MLTTALDLLAVASLAAFAWFVWEPLPLVVIGAAAIAASWKLEHGKVKRP